MVVVITVDSTVESVVGVSAVVLIGTVLAAVAIAVVDDGVLIETALEDNDNVCGVVLPLEVSDPSPELELPNIERFGLAMSTDEELVRDDDGSKFEGLNVASEGGNEEDTVTYEVAAAPAEPDLDNE